MIDVEVALTRARDHLSRRRAAVTELEGLLTHLAHGESTLSRAWRRWALPGGILVGAVGYVALAMLVAWFGRAYVGR